MPQTKKILPDKNDPLHRLLETVTAAPPVWTGDAYGNYFAWLHLKSPAELKKTAESLAGKVRLCTITAYAEERDDTNKRRRIAYHFASGRTVVTVTVPVYDPESLRKLPVPSITPWFRNADWNEREFREMFNIEVEGHPNPERLFLDERLDAGIMTRLIPFSAMANSAGTNTLWERILEAKGVPPEERLPSLSVPLEPIKVEPDFTPVLPEQPIEPSLATPTLANIARSAEEAALALGRKREQAAPPAGEAVNKVKADTAPARPKAEQAVKADAPASKPVEKTARPVAQSPKVVAPAPKAEVKAAVAPKAKATASASPSGEGGPVSAPGAKKDG